MGGGGGKPGVGYMSYGIGGWWGGGRRSHLEQSPSDGR